MKLSRWLCSAGPVLLLGCADAATTGPADAGTALRRAAHDGGNVASVFPSTVPVPNGFQPEGITVGRGSTFYVGSLAGPFAGAIYRGDLRSGRGEILVRPSGGTTQAVGLGYDSRSNLLYAAAATGAVLKVYHAETGALVASLSHPQLALANDLVITRDAVYVTDSFRAVLYRIPLGPAGRLASNAPVAEVALGGDYVFDPAVPFGINNNGIVATPNGKHLVVANTGTGLLYRVDPASGASTVIAVGPLLTGADGLVLEGRTLYVVRPFQNQVAVVELAHDFASGKVVRVITDEKFRLPTTGAIFGNSLHLVNGRFDVASPFNPTPPNILDIDFDVVRVPK